MKFYCSLIVVILTINFAIGQSLTANELLQKSIKYHDPKGKWGKFKGTLYFDQDSPNRAVKSERKAIFDQKKDYFRMEQTREGESISREVKGDKCTSTYNGSTTFSDEVKEKHRLTCDRAKMYRDYYSYLYGLPMKLKDPGTIIDPTVKNDKFQGKDCYSIKVTYDPEVGTDIWHFFFDKKNYALIGYLFYRKDITKDGEYITLEGEESIGGIKMPKDRRWYYNKDDKYLGADFLLSEKK